jgi:hypothetical protein
MTTSLLPWGHKKKEVTYRNERCQDLIISTVEVEEHQASAEKKAGLIQPSPYCY